MRTLLMPIVAGIVLGACNRGPEPAPLDEEPSEPAAPHREEKASGSQRSGASADPHAGLDIAPAGGGSRAAGSSGGTSAGGLAWSVASPLVSRPPASSMRAAEYVVEGESGNAPAVMTVHFFGQGQGGSIEDNIDRWLRQFRPRRLRSQTAQPRPHRWRASVVCRRSAGM